MTEILHFLTFTQFKSIITPHKLGNFYSLEEEGLVGRVEFLQNADDIFSEV